MTEISRLISLAERGDVQSTQQLFLLLYNELRQLAKRQLASEPPGHTLQTTALVHEAFMRLLGSEDRWQNQLHFFSAAAEAMRRVLVDHARRKQRQKRGGNIIQVELCEDTAQIYPLDDGLLDLNEALAELEENFPGPAQLVKLRFFGGLTMVQIADLLQISTNTADRHWTFARAWLRRRIKA